MGQSTRRLLGDVVRGIGDTSERGDGADGDRGTTAAPTLGVPCAFGRVRVHGRFPDGGFCFLRCRLLRHLLHTIFGEFLEPGAQIREAFQAMIEPILRKAVALAECDRDNRSRSPCAGKK